MEATLHPYTELISELKDTIYRLALSLVGDSAEAEDITQDIYERVWRARDAVLSQSHPKAYICRMTRNLAIDHLRQRKRLGDEGEDGYRIIAMDDGNRLTDTHDMAELTRRIIQQLPERQRIAIHMRDVEGYEIEEIAQTMESDPASVRMNLSRGRKAVREQLLRAMNYGIR